MPAADVDLVADVLWFLGATAIGEHAADAQVVLEVGFVTDDDARAAVEHLADRFPTVPGAVVDAGPALEAALDEWKAFARPVRAGGFHVRPPWLADDDEPPRAEEVVVVIDPGRAFGSGSHPSTEACLVAVRAHVHPGDRVLDVGCGSGVLAIAAALLGAGPVLGLDVDPVAVAATLGNAARNGVTVDATTTPAADVVGRFDVVLANIGAATLRSLAPALLERLEPGGRLVLSGVLAVQANDVAAAYDGLAELDRSVGEWATIVLGSAKSQH